MEWKKEVPCNTLLSAGCITGNQAELVGWRVAGVGDWAVTQTSKSVLVLISLTHCMNAGVTDVL